MIQRIVSDLPISTTGISFLEPLYYLCYNVQRYEKSHTNNYVCISTAVIINISIAVTF